MTSLLENFGNEKYVLLTTFRKDGTPKPLPIWIVASGDDVAIWTGKESWKVKRIRNTPQVTLQACTRDGKKTWGPVVEGTAEIVDDEGTERIKKAITAKYKLLGWILVKGSDLRSKKPTIGVVIR